MEPEITKKITNEAMCTFQGVYALAMFVLIVLALIVSMFTMKNISLGMKILTVITSIVVMAIGFLQYYLIPYLVCTRALLAEQKVVLKKEGFRY